MSVGMGAPLEALGVHLRLIPLPRLRVSKIDLYSNAHDHLRDWLISTAILGGPPGETRVSRSSQVNVHFSRETLNREPFPNLCRCGVLGQHRGFLDAEAQRAE